MREKVAHFHIEDPSGHKKTLICYLTRNKITYLLYDGTGNSGEKLDISNLKCNSLPYTNPNFDSREVFKNRIKNAINIDSVCKIIDELKPISYRS